MTNTLGIEIQDLPPANAPAGTEPIPCVQDGQTRKITIAQIQSSQTQTASYVVAFGSVGLLANSRILQTTGAGLTLVDGGAGSSLTIGLQGNPLALQNIVTTGILVETAPSTMTTRTLVAPASGITITNADGVSGNPTFALAGTLLSLQNLSGVGGVYRTGSDIFTLRSITGTTDQITVTNGDGVSGSPTLTIASNAILPGTGGVTLPQGTTGQRAGGDGTIRYNTSLNQFEGKASGTWGSLGSGGGGSGTVTDVSVVTANGISGSVANSTTTPAITLTLGFITPTTVNGLTLAAQSVGFTIAGGSTSKTLTVPLNATVSGTNTGDQTTSGTSNRIDVSNGMTNPVIDISSTYVGQTSITTLGTISTGTWSATTIAVNKGGTGQTSYTDGQLLIGNSSGNTLAKATLTAGTNITITNGNGTITIDATGGSGSVTTTGSPASGNLTKFSGATSITNGDLSGDITTSGTLATTVAKIAGTTVSGTTGSGNVVFSTSPTLVTPILGTPTSGTLTNTTGLPIATGVSGLGSGIATFLATPSSANLATAVTDETGSGALVFATSPTLVTPALGTPASGVMTNVTGTASGLTSGITLALKSATTTVDVSAATAPSSGQVLTATDSTHATWQTPTAGTVTSVSGTSNRITSTGGDTPVIDISASYVGQSSITTLGTIATGVWNGTAVDVAHGGTGNTTFTAYSVICAGTTATGVFQNVSGVGTSGQVLTSAGAGALPTWTTVTGTGTVTTVSVVTANGVSGSVANATTTPAITLTLGAITPSSVAATGTITGTKLLGTIDDAVTNAVTFTERLTHTSSGTTAPGFGVGTEYQLENASGTSKTASTFSTLWGTATAGSEEAYFDFQVMHNGALTDYALLGYGFLQIQAGGLANLINAGNYSVNTDAGSIDLIATGGSGITISVTDDNPIVISAVGSSDITLNPDSGVVFIINPYFSGNITSNNTWTGSNTYNVARTIASGASAVLDDVNVAASTTTVTGSTHITTAKGFNKVSLYKPTITDSSSVTIDNAATLYIEAAPLAAGSVTITNPYAIWVDNDNVRFDGTGNIIGTVTSGTWNGTAVDVAHGGTGDTSFTAYSVICGGTTSTGALQNVSGVGTSGQVLTSNGASALPTWQAAGSGTVTTTGSPSSGNLTKFSGGTSITNGDLSGDVTTSGTLATTVAKIAGTTVSGTTGSVNVVFSTSPTLTTPTIGVATATSINKVTITAPTSSATLTLVDGSTLVTAGAHSITLTSTADTVVTLPTTGTLVNTAVTSLSSLVTVGTLTGGATGAGFTVALGTSTITGILGSANGGTANGFTKFSGPSSSEKTFTLPDASATVLTDNAAVTAAQGGTGIASYAVGDILYASASTTLSKLADVATGNALISGGVTTAPSWGKIGLTTHISGTLAVGNGGTGAATFTANAVLTGNTTSAINATPMIVDASTGAISGYAANVNAQTGTTYTVASTDAGKIITFSNGSAITVTLPNSLGAGFICGWYQKGAGQVSFTAAASGNLRNAHSQSKSFGQYAGGSLYVDSNGGTNPEWYLTGDTGA